MTKLSKPEAWRKAANDALAHHYKTSRRDNATTEQMLQGLYAGLRIVREKMTANTLRTSDLEQLIACALDCMGAGYYDASQRGEGATLPPEVS